LDVFGYLSTVVGDEKLTSREDRIGPLFVSRKPLAVLVVPIQEDVIADQLSLFEEYDPFTGEKNKRK